MRWMQSAPKGTDRHPAMPVLEDFTSGAWSSRDRARASGSDYHHHHPGDDWTVKLAVVELLTAPETPVKVSV